MSDKMMITVPARIVEYFSLTQTATIQISAEMISNNDSENGKLITIKPLEGVPVHTPSGGGWSMTMPIKEGDTCVIWFSQVGYDHWLFQDKDTAGTLANMPKPWLRRSFHKDDGFAEVGYNTLDRAIQDYTTDGSQWRNVDATQHIHLKEDLSIEITSPTKLTINAPSVITNCETAVVNASTSTTVTCPENEITGNTLIGGNLTVEGEVVGKLNISAGANVAAAGGLAAGVPLGGGSSMPAGVITGENAVLTGTYNGITVQTHTHDETSTTTLGPNS